MKQSSYHQDQLKKMQQVKAGNKGRSSVPMRDRVKNQEESRRKRFRGSSI